MRFEVRPSLAVADEPFEWYVDNDWHEMADRLIEHFEEKGWPNGAGDFVFEVVDIDGLDNSYERTTARRLIKRVSTSKPSAHDLENLCWALYMVQEQWDAQACACVLVMFESMGMDLGTINEEDRLDYLEATEIKHYVVDMILGADGDSVPEWLLSAIDREAIVDKLDFLHKITLDDTMYWVYDREG